MIYSLLLSLGDAFVLRLIRSPIRRLRHPVALAVADSSPPPDARRTHRRRIHSPAGQSLVHGIVPRLIAPFLGWRSRGRGKYPQEDEPIGDTSRDPTIRSRVFGAGAAIQVGHGGFVFPVLYRPVLWCLCPWPAAVSRCALSLVIFFYFPQLVPGGGWCPNTDTSRMEDAMRNRRRPLV